MDPNLSKLFIILFPVIIQVTSLPTTATEAPKFHNVQNSSAPLWQSFGEMCTPEDDDPFACDCNPNLHLECTSRTCGKCICRPYMYYNRHNKNCTELPRTSLYCFIEEIITPCIEGPKLYGEECLYNATLGKNKSQHNNLCRSCDSNLSLICNADFICSCPRHMYYDYNSKQCIVRAGKSCTNQNICAPNSSCIKRKCACNQGFILDKSSGHCFLGFNETCGRGRDKTTKCYRNAGLQCNFVDRDGQMRCGCDRNRYFKWFGGTCVGLEGTWCDPNNSRKVQCSPKAHCDERTRKCVCDEGYKAVTWNRECFQSCNYTAVRLCRERDKCDQNKNLVCNPNNLCRCRRDFSGCKNCRMRYDHEADECRMTERSRCECFSDEIKKETLVQETGYFKCDKKMVVESSSFKCESGAVCLPCSNSSSTGNAHGICVRIENEGKFKKSFYEKQGSHDLGWHGMLVFICCAIVVAWIGTVKRNT